MSATKFFLLSLLLSACSLKAHAEPQDSIPTDSIPTPAILPDSIVPAPESLPTIASLPAGVKFIPIPAVEIPMQPQLIRWCREKGIATSLNAAFTVGTTGLGIEISTPVTRWMDLRVGFEGIPQFRMPLWFEIGSYTDGKINENFDKIKDLMFKITDEEMQERVKLAAKPKIANFKLLVDVYPFKANRKWHVTAGFYLGSSTIGTAINEKSVTPTLVTMSMYDRLYTRLEHLDYLNEPIFGDVYLTKEKYEEIMSYGRLGIHIGDYKKTGLPYNMEPSESGSVTARAKANRFKPYLGVGFSSAVDRRKRLNIGFEAGAIFWGGAPQVILHDGTNLTKDIVNIRGKFGDYMDLVKALPVYPVVQFKMSYTIF